MRLFRSIRKIKYLSLLFTIILAATITEAPDYYSYNLQKIVVIGNVANSTNIYTENSPRTKHDFWGLVFKCDYYSANLPLSVYSYLGLNYWSPKDSHLPAKSDRAPPEKNLS